MRIDSNKGHVTSKGSEHFKYDGTLPKCYFFQEIRYENH